MRERLQLQVDGTGQSALEGEGAGNQTKNDLEGGGSGNQTKHSLHGEGGGSQTGDGETFNQLAAQTEVWGCRAQCISAIELKRWAMSAGYKFRIIKEAVKRLGLQDADINAETGLMTDYKN